MFHVVPPLSLTAPLNAGVRRSGWSRNTYREFGRDFLDKQDVEVQYDLPSDNLESPDSE